MLIEHLHFATVELGLGTLLALLGFAHAIAKITTYNPIRLPHVVIWATAAFFGLGPWLAFAYGGGNLPYEESSLIFGEYTAIYLYVGGIAVAAAIVPHLTGDSLKGMNPPSGWEPMGYVIQELRRAPRAGILLGMGLVWVLRLYLIIKYNTLGSVGVNAGGESVPYILRIPHFLSDFVIYGIVWWAVAKLTEDGETGYFPVLIIVSELVYIFPYGRSGFTFTVGLIIIGFITVQRRAKLKHFVLVSVTGLILLQVLFPLYHAFRVQWRSAIRSGATVNEVDEVVESAWSQSKEEIGEQYSSNMSRRPLIGRWICQIIAAQRLREPPGGEVLRHSLLQVVPTASYPEKSELPTPRIYINTYYGLEEADSPNSFPALIVADFGIFACFWAGLILGIFLMGLEYAAIRLAKRYPLYAGMLLASTVWTLFVPALTTHTILLHLRSAVIFLVFFVILDYLTSYGRGQP